MSKNFGSSLKESAGKEKICGLFKNILCNRKGDIFIFVMILIFFISLFRYFDWIHAYREPLPTVEYRFSAELWGGWIRKLDEYRRDGYARWIVKLQKKNFMKLTRSMKLDSELNKTPVSNGYTSLNFEHWCDGWPAPVWRWTGNWKPAAFSAS